MRVVVVGAGIIGVCAALYLQRDRHVVTIVDPQEPGSGCSFGNSGLIAPGHCVPLAMPGVLTHIPGWLLDQNGPLRIRWRYFPRAIPWLVRFLAASRRQRVRQSAAALRALHAGTFEDYAPLLLDARSEHLVRRTGELCVYDDEASFIGDAAALDLQRENGVNMRLLTGAEAREIEPHLTTSVVRAILYPDAGHCVNPGLLVNALAAAFVAHGGVIQKAHVHGFERVGSRVTGVGADSGMLGADLVVIAAGSHSGDLVRLLGDAAPIEPLRGYHAVFTDPGFKPNLPVHSASGKFTATPMDMGIRCGGTIEIAGHESPPDYRRAKTIARQAQGLYPAINAASLEFWMGHRPSTPDSVPIIDRATSAPNVFYAFGHGPSGLMGAATTGRLVADLAARRPETINLKPFRVARF